jgi:hypothetical protein
MQATPDETRAAQQLAEALMQFVVAIESGAAVRRDAREKERSRVLAAAGVSARPSISPTDTPSGRPAGPQLLTVREAAKMLSVSTRHLIRLSAPHGPIPVVRFGVSVRYSSNDLLAAIQKMKSQPR